MGSSTAASTCYSMLSSSSSGLAIRNSSPIPYRIPPQNPLHLKTTGTPLLLPTSRHNLRYPILKNRATLDAKDQSATILVCDEEKEPLSKEVEESVKLLKNVAKTRKVAAEEILSAFSVIEKAKLDPSGFLETLGGSKSPGRTWMLIFTAEKGLKGGKYFPITAVQRFDAAAKRIENGVYLGRLGCLTFEGRLSWKKRILAFIFECVRIKIGPFRPFEINFKGKDVSEPTTKNPFFIWFYVDEEIAVARGKSGGTAFWCRCRRVNSY